MPELPPVAKPKEEFTWWQTLLAVVLFLILGAAAIALVLAVAYFCFLVVAWIFGIFMFLILFVLMCIEWLFIFVTSNHYLLTFIFVVVLAKMSGRV